MCHVNFLLMTSTNHTVCIAHFFIIIEEWVPLEANNREVDIFSELCSHEV